MHLLWQRGHIHVWPRWIRKHALYCWWRANNKVDPSLLVGQGNGSLVDAIITQILGEGLQTWDVGPPTPHLTLDFARRLDLESRRLLICCPAT
jgi:hypothetical protein